MVRVGRRRDDDRVEVVGVDHLSPVVGDALDAEPARQAGKVRLGGVGPDDEFRAVDVPRQVLRMYPAHSARAEDAETQRVSGLQ